MPLPVALSTPDACIAGKWVSERLISFCRSLSVVIPCTQACCQLVKQARVALAHKLVGTL